MRIIYVWILFIALVVVCSAFIFATGIYDKVGHLGRFLLGLALGVILMSLAEYLIPDKQ
jgi:small neutral amino acid transporter SnatA (MarC family)